MNHEPNNIMLDIETLGTRPSSVILSIGMVKFDPAKRELGDTYYRVLSSQDQLDMERTQDDSTVKWWSEQSKEASSVLFQSAAEGSEGGMVHQTLMEMGEWMGPEPRLWGNGAGFDNVLLRSLFDTYGVKAPWSFRHDRCYRTLQALANGKVTNAKMVKHGIVSPRFEGIRHHALDDAKNQAEAAMTLMRYL
jgi:hypothetical protein